MNTGAADWGGPPLAMVHVDEHMLTVPHACAASLGGGRGE